MLRASFERQVKAAMVPGGMWQPEQGTAECAPRCQLRYACFIE